MGYTRNSVPIQLTRAFREAQSNEQFQGWLKMQEAVMEIEFPYYDLPEIREQMFTKDSLATVEAKLLELYPDKRAAFATTDDVHRTMRYVYYIGETFRRGFDGTWVVLPSADPDAPAPVTQPVVDLPFREAFIKPLDLLEIAILRRKGNRLTTVYEHMQRLQSEWVDAGRPERTYFGTLREEG